MAEADIIQPELPNFITLLANKIGVSSHFSKYLYLWENIIFSLIVVCIISVIAYLASRKKALIPGRLQSACELVIGTLDDFVCGVLGQKGRAYTPFIGTLFIYIISMNLLGLIPFMKSPTSSWSITLGLAICVFIYVQYSAVRELGLLGYLDHMMGRPRGLLAFSVFIPLMLLILHIVTELVRPISLSLRLRSNIWGDDMLLAVLSGFGLKGILLLIFSSILVIIASIVQALVFSLLSAIYFALVLTHEE